MGPSSWDMVLIIPLLKEAKDSLQVENYWPIALMCADFKVLIGVMAARLLSYTLHIFLSHHAGFTKGRSTHDTAAQFSYLVQMGGQVHP